MTEKTTIVLFSGELDKAMAAYIIANGAAALDHDVTIFHTFWGLNVLRKNEKIPVEKTFIEKIIGRWMPRGPKKLNLSKMHMGGLGTTFMKEIMKKHRVLSLEDLINLSMDQGIKRVACQMTVDLLGLKQEELIEETQFGGVTSYLGEASQGGINLFI